MTTDYKTLTRENGWIFQGNCQHETPYPYSSRGMRTHHGCLYLHEYSGKYLYQWHFDTKGNAAYQTTFGTSEEMHKFFD